MRHLPIGQIQKDGYVYDVYGPHEDLQGAVNFGPHDCEVQCRSVQQYQY